VTPHKDITAKSFSEVVFAADLGDVLSGTAPEEYRDPRLFFAKTYLTEGLQNLARNVLSRLGTGKDDRHPAADPLRRRQDPCPLNPVPPGKVIQPGQPPGAAPGLAGGMA